jgi:hypothetical protein
MANTTLYRLHRGDNSTINSTELAGYLDAIGQDEFIVMAVQPNLAYDIWTAAYNLVRIGLFAQTESWWISFSSLLVKI